MSATTEVSATEALSPEQLTFLKDNFVVYDFYKKESHQDFSGLANCQVILMGETHDSSILKTIQKQFFEKIIGNQLICRLKESLAPGLILTPKEAQEYYGDSIPSSTVVRGADVRHSAFKDAARAIEWEKMNRRVIQSALDKKGHTCAYAQRLARILNDHFTSEFSLGADKETQMFLLSDEVSETVAQLVKDMDREEDLRRDETSKIRIQMNQLLSSSDHTRLEVLESNRGLYQEMEKACQQFPKVIAIWGSDHFTTDEDLIKAWDRARISYVVLLPNKQRHSEASDEVDWQHCEIPTFEMRVGKKTQPLVLQLPEICRSYFHPELQAICISKTQKPMVLNAQKLQELFLEGDTFEFPAGQEVHFENIPLTDFNKFRELFDRGISLGLYAGHIGVTISNLLMIHGLVADLHFKGKIESCQVFTTTDYKPTLAVSTKDKGWSLTVSSEVRIGYASYFFQEMKRLNMEEYSLAPGEVLYFLDISHEELEQMAESPEKIGHWIDSKLPPNYQLAFKGEPFLAPSGLSLLEGAPSLPALVLGSETGLSIKLVSLPEMSGD